MRDTEKSYYEHTSTLMLLSSLGLLWVPYPKGEPAAGGGFEASNNKNIQPF